MNTERRFPASLELGEKPEIEEKIKELREKVQAKIEEVKKEQEKNCPGFENLDESLQKILVLGSLSTEELKAKIFLNREERSKRGKTLSTEERDKINTEIIMARVFLMTESRGKISASREKDEKKRFLDDVRTVNKYLEYLESQWVHQFRSEAEGAIANSAENFLKIHYNAVRSLYRDNYKTVEELTHKPIIKEEIESLTLEKLH